MTRMPLRQPLLLHQPSPPLRSSLGPAFVRATQSALLRAPLRRSLLGRGGWCRRFTVYTHTPSLQPLLLRLRPLQRHLVAPLLLPLPLLLAACCRRT